jgi:hypothetical protein
VAMDENNNVFWRDVRFKKGTGLLRVRVIHPYLILQATTNNVDICI